MPRIVRVTRATTTLRSFGIASLRVSTQTGRRPSSASSSQQTSPRATTAPRELPRGRLPSPSDPRARRPKGPCQRGMTPAHRAPRLRGAQRLPARRSIEALAGEVFPSLSPLGWYRALPRSPKPLPAPPSLIEGSDPVGDRLARRESPPRFRKLGHLGLIPLFSLCFGLACLPPLVFCGLLCLGASHPCAATVLRSGVLGIDPLVCHGPMIGVVCAESC